MSIEYKLELEGEEVIACDCCQSEVPTHLFLKPASSPSEILNPRQNRFCEVCSNTFISNTYTYSKHYGHDLLHSMQCLAACTNIILSAINRHHQEEKLNHTGVLLNWLWKVTVVTLLIWGLVS